MLSGDKVIKLIDNLDTDEREKVLAHVLQKYFKDVWIFGSNYDWWDNKQDDEHVAQIEQRNIVNKSNDTWCGEDDYSTDKD